MKSFQSKINGLVREIVERETSLIRARKNLFLAHEKERVRLERSCVSPERRLNKLRGDVIRLMRTERDNKSISLSSDGVPFVLTDDGHYVSLRLTSPKLEAPEPGKLVSKLQALALDDCVRVVSTPVIQRIRELPARTLKRLKVLFSQEEVLHIRPANEPKKQRKK